MLAPTSRSLAVLVATEPLLGVVLEPVAATVTSKGVEVSSPLYSRIRISASGMLPLKATVAVLAPAAAATMFLA